MRQMMNKTTLILVISFLLMAAIAGGCSQAQPRLEVETATVDLGDVTNGVIETRQIPVRNSGEGELVIDTIGTSCGCTEAVVTPSTIPPGGEGVLEISFDSGAHGPGLTGQMLRQIFIQGSCYAYLDLFYPHRTESCKNLFFLCQAE